MNNQSTPPAGNVSMTAHSRAHHTDAERTSPPRPAPRYQAEQPDDLIIIGTDNAPEPRKKAVPVGAHRKRISKTADSFQGAVSPPKPSHQELGNSNLAASAARTPTFGNFLTVPKLPKRRSSHAPKMEANPGITDVRGTPQIAGGSFIAPHASQGIQDIVGGSFIAEDRTAMQSASTEDGGTDGGTDGDETEAEETEADDEDEDEEGGVPLPMQNAGDGDGGKTGVI
ncbi:hypothetical protein H2199_008918 [Coniosporium tulheliwenetii]|uniref:Uncharacterized protein n=1 Tax=Coniosporium tulheliwenetii TaxID=3383036 RepID=A0ACC2YHC7_9PEZI|nr:hypothetical protein H2199_008918 [Cladosporium sp. JES 115]